MSTDRRAMKRYVDGDKARPPNGNVAGACNSFVNGINFTLLMSLVFVYHETKMKPAINRALINSNQIYNITPSISGTEGLLTPRARQDTPTAIYKHTQTI